MPDTPNDKTDTDGQKIKNRLEILLSRYAERDPSREMEAISEYLAFLSDAIDIAEATLCADLSLVRSFEAVTLLLRDRLPLYPDSLRSQIIATLEADRLSDFMALLAALPSPQLAALRRRDRNRLALSGITRHFTTRPPDSPDDSLSPSRFLRAKVALNRLAQILRFASTLELLDYDLEIDDLKEYYDPSLIERPRVVALVNVLKLQIGDLPADVRSHFEDRLDKIEREIQRPKPRWGRIIASIFVLFSFVADLKALSPGTYDAVFHTVESIVLVLHRGPLVHGAERSLLLLSSPPEGSGSDSGIGPHPEASGPSVEERGHGLDNQGQR